MVAPEHVSVSTHELEPAEWDNADVSRLALNVDPVKVSRSGSERIDEAIG